MDITIISSDNVKFVVKTTEIVASKENENLSKMLRNYMSDMNVNEINLPIIEKDVFHSDVLKYILEFCKLQSENPPKHVEGSNEEIQKIIEEHIKYHLDELKERINIAKNGQITIPLHFWFCNNEEYDGKISIRDVIDECKYKMKYIPKTYWYKLNDNIKENIKSNIIELFKKYEYLNYTIDEYEDLWNHVMTIHHNGYCCEKEYESDTKEIIIPNWCSDFFTKFKNTDKNLEEHILTKLIIVGEYLGIQNLIDFSAKTMSEIIEENFSGIDKDENLMIRYRNFLGQTDDVSVDDKDEISELLKLLKD